MFYPEGLAQTKFLSYYASKFDAVEVDYTFYRMPNAKTIDAWTAATPDDFRFALKAPQKITHRERLQLPSEALGYWLSISSKLGSRLGMILYQLPPFLKCDAPRLEAFLAELPASTRVAFEFRHATWFTDEVYRILKGRSAALCINDSDEQTTPLELTAPFTYVRLRRSEYTPEQLAMWAERVVGWVGQGADVFAFIKHEDNPRAPLIALDFAKTLAR